MRQHATKTPVQRLLCLVLVGIMVLLGIPVAASAHFSSTGYSDITVKDKQLQYGLFLSEHDLLEALPLDLDKNGSLSAEELMAARPELEKFISSYLIVTGDGKVGKGQLQQAAHTMRGKVPMIGMDVTYDYAQNVQRFQLQYGVFYNGLNPEHRSYATIKLGAQTIEQVLNRNNNIVQIKGTAAELLAKGKEAGMDADKEAAQDNNSARKNNGWLQVMTDYTWSGMTHIWSGIDHLLFLFGILLTTRNKWMLLRSVTAFTVGHSITLVLSALDLATVSPLVIEPLIALSIAYIAVECLLSKAQREQWQLTLGFGLIHGFGFAEILKGTLSENIVLPLLSFNIGVELGQIAVLLIVLPLLLLLRKYETRPIWRQALASVIGLFGLYWFVERVMSA